MFFGGERTAAIREMILSETTESREKALAKLLPFQRTDFVGIFTAMDGLPVTVRLLDPPLHEFVPHDEKQQGELAKEMGLSLEQVKRRVAQLHEANPMLGHRGCRLAITYPEILRMQIRAIVDEELEQVWAGKKSAREALDTAVKRGNEQLERFEKANKG
jgi:pyruvate,orthophosphate dikinase